MQFTIPRNHPALAGHFPGQPVVPAVVILDEVLAAAAQWAPTARISRVIQAKFTALLLPDQSCSIDFRSSPAGLRYVCAAEGRTVASGLLGLEPGTP